MHRVTDLGRVDSTKVKVIEVTKKAALQDKPKKGKKSKMTEQVFSQSEPAEEVRASFINSPMYKYR